MKPKIYIAHSSSYDFRKELYTPIKDSELYDIYNIILPHYKREYHPDSKKEISESKFFIAEISYASTGAGIEIGWADAFDIPIIFLHKTSYTPAPYYNEMSKFMVSYISSKEMVTKLMTILT